MSLVDEEKNAYRLQIAEIDSIEIELQTYNLSPKSENTLQEAKQQHQWGQIKFTLLIGGNAGRFKELVV